MLASKATSDATAGGLTSSKKLGSTMAAVKEVPTAVKFDVCVDTLMNGCVNAYVQLFELSHRPPVCVDELAQTMFVIPEEQLEWVQATLINIEMHRRRSNFRESFNESIKLASYFEECRDMKQTIAQHEIALQHAAESLDRALEGEAHETFGLLYERLQNTAEAVLHHETRLKLAEVVGDAQLKLRASKNLLRVYLKRGEETLATGDPQGAKTYFERAVATARASGDSTAEAQAYAALGNVTVLLGDLNRALEYQKRFMVASREAKDDHHESIAAMKVAALQEQLGQPNEAITSLKAALSLAEKGNDLKAIFDACRQLGEVYFNSHEPFRAVHYLQQAFNVARDIGDPSMIESARILLGFAKGNHHFSDGERGYLGIVHRQLATQLEWLGSGVL